MSSLKLFMMYKHGVSLTLVCSPNWKGLSLDKATVYFHPEESVHEFVGELFLKNYSINFVPFTEKVVVRPDVTVYFLVRKEPDTLWMYGQRWAIPAKGTRVR